MAATSFIAFVTDVDNGLGSEIDGMLCSNIVTHSSQEVWFSSSLYIRKDASILQMQNPKAETWYMVGCQANSLFNGLCASNQRQIVA